MFNIGKTLEKELNMAYASPLHTSTLIYDEAPIVRSKSVKIGATFKGKDGSVGYRTGRVYLIDVLISADDPFAVMVSLDSVQSSSTTIDYQTCPYSTMQAFYDNWEVPEEYKNLINKQRTMLKLLS